MPGLLGLGVGHEGRRLAGNMSLGGLGMSALPIDSGRRVFRRAGFELRPVRREGGAVTWVAPMLQASSW